jgi:signal transduction histidine kinase
MRRRPSLRLRVALAFAGLGALSSLLLALGVWYAAHDVSQRLMDETLAAEMADYVARRARNPRSLPPASASLRGYLLAPGARSEAATPPPGVAALPPGHHEVVIDGVPYRVAVADRDGARHLLLFDESRQQRRERRFLAYLLGSAGLMTVLAALGGFWLAGRVIAPVTELARAVSGAEPSSPPRLARDGGPGDEIDELAHAFDRYLDRLAAFVERERAFAADASHELRTPLAVIRGAAEVLADSPGLTAAERERVARIERAAAEMGELSAALLLLAREEDTPVETPCDAARVVAECVERYRPLAASRGTRIETALDGAVALRAPPALFAIVVANLLHNAVAHTQGGRVAARLDAHGLEIADTGAGIPAADLERVFERHFRGPQSAGAGIGLALVKRVCARLGWEVSLVSDPASGTVATLRFNAALTA